MRNPEKPVSVAKFRSLVRKHYRSAGRPMPWREDPRPYNILVSELMLQQTQVERVLPKYLEFLRAAPNLTALAELRAERLLSLWSGLGYNRRALALRGAAQMIIERFGGKLPCDEELLQELPGVGPYTAAAICAFAYNKPAVLIETNIRTVYLHHFFPERRAVDDKEIYQIAKRCLDRKDPRSWHYALMDYGVHLKRAGHRLNHQSRHYRPQSPFAGSRRELRGKVLQLLLQEERLTVSRMAKLLSQQQELVLEVARELADEGFAKLSRGALQLDA